MMSQAINKMPSLFRVEEALNSAGFQITETETYFVKDNLQDLFLYSCKNKPELCFDESIRNGISTFTLTDNKKELEIGLNKLRCDIDENKLDSIKRKYENEHGDYLFIVALK